MGNAFALALALSIAPPQAFGLEPGQAAYIGGTAGLAPDTPGTLDATSPSALAFHYKKADGTPGEIDVAYKDIRTFESRDEVAHHLGVLPAIAVGLMAPRIRRHYFTLNYADATGTSQIVIFEVAQHDQPAMEALFRARAPRQCYRGVPACAPTPATPLNPAPAGPARPAAASPAPATASPALSAAP